MNNKFEYENFEVEDQSLENNNEQQQLKNEFFSYNYCLKYIPIKTAAYILLLLSIIELILAFIFHHKIGVFIGIFCLAIGYIELYQLKQQQLQIQNINSIQGDKKTFLSGPLVQKKITRLFFISGSIFIVLLLMIRIFCLKDAFSQKHFPDKCDDKPNCVMVSDKNQFRNQQLYPLILDASVQQIQDFTKDYFSKKPGTWIVNVSEYKQQNDENIKNNKNKNDNLSNQYTYIFAKFVTSFWGFINDIGILINCENDQVYIQAISQSVIGYDDFGVNYDIINDFFINIEENEFEKMQC
ncbi:hypothetical protein PPERSA_04324 [Pseudocohnilembus persalinus]|uniref:Transmembrane protein n=1 Tax=Pseudocohnilembus persalinus TaxID=266149 RepID=A0A0V0QQR1_PSEPJ|nr:hypothetical protein PPERSA_04324 [Pseudocohnilembus persalinus]|eukprot:KRX04509.1 hypothetical protein PPERSA_04324 [Pseudocohnilembus persalinus]